jgi:hypothetical protein
MKKTLEIVRCVPRYGYENTQVRTVEIDLPANFDEDKLLESLRQFFALRGVPDAVFDISVDDDGFFAIVNDEAYDFDWGEPLL